MEGPTPNEVGAAPKQERDEDWEKRVTDEVDRNFEVFRELLPGILKTKRGQIALMRDGEIVDYFTTRGKARKAAEDRYPDGIWSIQKVSDETAYLGPIS